MKPILSLTLACAILAAFTHYATAAPGDLDLSFNPSVNGFVSNLAVQPDGKILIGGRFTEVDGIARHGLARLHSDGKLDATFTPALAVNWLNSFAIQSNGKILIGGVITNMHGAEDTYLARLNADGSRDSEFNPVVAGREFSRVYQIALQADGKILLAGNFTNVNGVARNSLARLNTDGTLDSGFYPLAESSNEYNVYDLALQPDGKVLVIRVGGIGGTVPDDFVRLNWDGTLDPGFHVQTDDSVESLALQADGKIVIGGHFSRVGGVRRLVWRGSTQTARWTSTLLLVTTAQQAPSRFSPMQTS